MDFFEEINLMKAKIASGELTPEAVKNKIREISTGLPLEEDIEEEHEESISDVSLADSVEYKNDEERKDTGGEETDR